MWSCRNFHYHLGEEESVGRVIPAPHAGRDKAVFSGTNGVATDTITREFTHKLMTIILQSGHVQSDNASGEPAATSFKEKKCRNASKRIRRNICIRLPEYYGITI
jgi:hypothetical protein